LIGIKDLYGAVKTEIQRNNQLPETVNYSFFQMSV